MCRTCRRKHIGLQIGLSTDDHLSSRVLFPPAFLEAVMRAGKLAGGREGSKGQGRIEGQEHESVVEEITQMCG